MQVIDNVEDDDDLSPLRAALDKARARSERLEKAREEKEMAALKVAETAIGERDRLEQVKQELQTTEHTMHKREEQLKKMAQQKENIEAELSKHMDSDALTSVDLPPSQDAASVGAEARIAAICRLHSDVCQSTECQVLTQRLRIVSGTLNSGAQALRVQAAHTAS